mmetsp:Transcript_1003/g.3141  ORF Transcript_1003/g.3141 Transcript_1003/m.3141 type:complete len:204 (+) Transcript_1003:1772-2383(+)
MAPRATGCCATSDRHPQQRPPRAKKSGAERGGGGGRTFYSPLAAAAAQQHAQHQHRCRGAVAQPAAPATTRARAYTPTLRPPPTPAYPLTPRSLLPLYHLPPHRCLLWPRLLTLLKKPLALLACAWAWPLPRCTLAPSCERREWQMLLRSLRLRGAPCARTHAHARERRRRAGGVRRTDGCRLCNMTSSQRCLFARQCVCELN